MAPRQLFIKGLDGATTIAHVSSLSELRSLTGAENRLVSGGVELFDTFDLQENATVHVLARLLGGGKKRKKKTYTKPKKVKHVHKKVKLAVLKYYKIDKDGKVERLRRECPEPVCGPGVFMAAHTDRMYCGRCQLTLVREDV